MAEQPSGGNWLAVWRSLLAQVDIMIAQRLARLPITGRWVLGSAVRGPIPIGSLPAHASTHQDGGGDEISVTGLSGLLADPQTPAAHTHAHASTTGQTANDHHNQAHNLFGADHSDVNVTTPPTDGQALLWDASMSKWLPGTVSLTHYEVLLDAGGNPITTEAGDWIYTEVAA